MITALNLAQIQGYKSIQNYKYDKNVKTNVSFGIKAPSRKILEWGAAGSFIAAIAAWVDVFANGGNFGNNTSGFLPKWLDATIFIVGISLGALASNMQAKSGKQRI